MIASETVFATTPVKLTSVFAAVVKLMIEPFAMCSVIWVLTVTTPSGTSPSSVSYGGVTMYTSVTTPVTDPKVTVSSTEIAALFEVIEKVE